MVTCTTALSNSMKPWTMLCRATQDGQVMVESSDKTWSIGERNGKPLQYSCLENFINSIKRQKDMTLKGELPKSAGVQNVTGEEWRNNSRKNEEKEPKQKQHPVVNVTGDGSPVMQKTILHRNLVHKSRKILSVQIGDGKGEHWHFQNQWTKIYRNGWI